MIGRKKEQEELLRRYRRAKAEFVAIYGRRRVGKTTLVAETFDNQFTFHHAGLSPVDGKKQGAMERQLDHFYHSLVQYGLKDRNKPENWMEAFYALEELLTQKDSSERQVIFIDELPWMDTPRSGFITALEAFWNGWACLRKNVMLVVCGSASSWILDKLINNHGGLYNRVTCEIHLKPFSLHECEAFLRSNEVRFTRYEIAECYMIFGGIPYYLDAMDERLSLAQNIDRQFFERDARLRDEYDRLFNSIFTNPDMMKSIISLLYRRRGGYTRKEISEMMGISGKSLTTCLKALVGSDFVERYVPFGQGKRDASYKLVDPFCLFYLHFVQNQVRMDEHFWTHQQAGQAVITWRGLAFENVCFLHIPQIKRALGISGVHSNQSAWVLRREEENTQADLIIDREDHVVNVCEIKFYSNEFSVNKSYYRELLARQDILREHISPRSAIYQTLISTFGLKKDEYAGIFTQTVTLDDLFVES